jgi:hypothetical protein
MSADNGIYVAKFPIDDGGNPYFEYRVAELQNIEDCYAASDRPKYITDAMIVVAFGDAKIYYNKDKAHTYAHKLYKDIMNSECPIIEYGVCELEFAKPIQGLTVSQAENVLAKYWLEFQNKHNRLEHVVEGVDAFLFKKDYLKELIEKSTPTPKETVYEGAVRYGKIAYQSYKTKMDDYDRRNDMWEDLGEDERQAWITVAGQIEAITLRENK